MSDDLSLTWLMLAEVLVTFFATMLGHDMVFSVCVFDAASVFFRSVVLRQLRNVPLFS